MNSNAKEEIVTGFDLVSDNFKISESLCPSITFDQNYKYYLKLLNVQFSNSVPNVTENQYVNSQLICEPGIYEIEDIIDLYNVYSATIGTLSLNNNTGKLKLENTTANTITISTSNLLTSEICNFTLPITLAPGSFINANSVVKISSFNYFILCSDNITGFTYTNYGGNGLKQTKSIYSFSSAIKPWYMKNWVATQHLIFELTGSQLQTLTFELRDSSNRSLISLGPSDFSVNVQIVRYKIR